jgi:phospho-N-acetylmuramoyl-pentapeptide-transferase
VGELAKEGGKVPTMGGLIIAAAAIPAVLLFARPGVLVYAALWCLVGMGLVGLYDDWLKVRHGSSDGISARLKARGEGLVALTAFGIVLLDPACREGLAEIWPFLKEPVWSAGSLGWPLAACLAVGMCSPSSSAWAAPTP